MQKMTKINLKSVSKAYPLVKFWRQKKEIPTTFASIEDGLKNMVRKLNLLLPVIKDTIADEYVLNKKFNLIIAEGSSFILSITPEEAKLEEGMIKGAQGTIIMNAIDWFNVLKGEYGITSVIMAGRTYIKQDEMENVAALGTLLYMLTLK